MPSMHIKVSKRTDEQYKGGPNKGKTYLKLGFNENGSWTNFKVDNPSLFEYLTQGKTGTAEYKVEHWQDNEGGDHTTNLITGFAPDAPVSSSSTSQSAARAGSHDDVTRESIERQVCIKAIAEVLAGSTETPDGLGKYIATQANILYDGVFARDSFRGNESQAHASARGDAPDDDTDDDIPF